MKHIYIITLLIITCSLNCMCSQEKNDYLLIKTSLGDIKVKLYSETPLHKDQYLKLADEGFFKDRIFHRIIADFMVQGGEPLNNTGQEEPEKIPAEIHFPQYYHKRGAIAAARMGDNANPEKQSNGNQFYIVTGKTFRDTDIEALEERRLERLKQQILTRLNSENMDTIKAMYSDGNKVGMAELREKLTVQAAQEAELRKPETRYSDEQKEIYRTTGGTPHLDGEYTVFGEVVEGMDVVYKIEAAQTNGQNRPIQPIVFSITRGD